MASWVHVDAGDVLFAEGDPSDAGYLVVSGRLAVTRGGVAVGEVGRGEIVGEIGLLEASPRSATVTALRDSSLVGFDVDAFAALTATHPRLMLSLVRTVVARVGRPGASTDRGRSIAVAVTAATDGHACVAALADELGTPRRRAPRLGGRGSTATSAAQV